MDKKCRRLWLGIMLLFLQSLCFAQQVTDTAASNGATNSIMRSNNKIFVVMAVCLTILAGLILYLIRIDIKISKAQNKSPE